MDLAVEYLIIQYRIQFVKMYKKVFCKKEDCFRETARSKEPECGAFPTTLPHAIIHRIIHEISHETTVIFSNLILNKF